MGKSPKLDVEMIKTIEEKMEEDVATIYLILPAADG